MAPHLEGIIVPLLTPFRRDDGDLDEPAILELPAEFGDDFRSNERRLPRIGIHHEVDVPLPRPGLDVLEPMPLLRQWTERL